MPIALPKDPHLAPQIFTYFAIQNNDIIFMLEEPFGIVGMDLSCAVHIDPRTGLASTDVDDILYAIGVDDKGEEHAVEYDWAAKWIKTTLNPYLREKFSV